MGHCRKDLPSPGLCVIKIGGIYILKHLQYIVRFCFCLVVVVVVVVLFCFFQSMSFFGLYQKFLFIYLFFIHVLARSIKNKIFHFLLS